MGSVFRAVVARRAFHPGGDDVPTGAPVTHVVNGGELAGEIVGLGVGARACRNEADALGGDRERGQQRDRLEPEAAGARRIAGQHQTVGKEQTVEQRGLRPPGEILVVRDIGQLVRRRLRVVPGGLVMAACLDEQVEVKLPGHGGALWLPEARACPDWTARHNTLNATRMHTLASLLRRPARAPCAPCLTAAPGLATIPGDCHAPDCS